MATFLHYTPNLLLFPFPARIKSQTSIPHRTRYYDGFLSAPSRGSLCVARLGFKPEFETTEGVIRELFGRAESLFYTIADAAVASSSDSVTTSKQSSDWLSGIANYMEGVLKVLEGGLSAVHIPYAYGFAIILLTILVKAATFPLTKKQVESAMSMRSLQPQIKAIQQRYAGDQERIQLETARLYKLAGINPLAGCLPTLATIPVWIGLYRALSNVANEGLLTEGFFWIPSLAGPTTVAARQSGSGISWLFPFVDGHPPLGWSDTFAYLVLPVLLVVSQYISVQIMQSSQSDDPNMKSSQAVTKFLPLMIGYFALSVPSGLSLYWLTNNILSTAQQVWLQKLGGAKIPIKQFSDDIINDNQSQIKKSVDSVKEGIEAKKLVSNESRPGDRFKQLKEQEARRKQQKEQEKLKAEGTNANGSQLIDKGDKKEADLAEKENEAGAGSVDDTNEIVQSVSSVHDSSDIGIVNGGLSGQDLKDSREMSSVPSDGKFSSEDTQQTRRE